MTSSIKAVGALIPTIQIQQQFAKIGMDTHPGTMEIRQPHADVEIRQTPLKIEIRSPQGELHIDQSRAWDALGLGNNLEFMSRIYSQSKQIALQGIARIVENGNRMAAIQNNTDAIADIASEQAFESGGGINYFGDPSYDNVDINYIAHKPEFEVVRGYVDINVRVNKPEINYTPGKVDVYMLQYPKVELIPPEIDMKV